MKITKYLLLLAVIAGVAGTFMPLANVKAPPAPAGNDGGSGPLPGPPPGPIGKMPAPPEPPAPADALPPNPLNDITLAGLLGKMNFNDTTTKIGAALIGLIAVTVLVAVLGVMSRLGRLLGLVSTLVGAVGVAVWVYMWNYMGSIEAPGANGSPIGPGTGMWLMASGPGGSFLFGLMALFNPEPKPDKKKK